MASGDKASKRDRIALPDAIQEPIGLGVQSSGVQGKHPHIRLDAARHVHEHHVLGPAERDRDVVEGLERQAQDVLGGLAAVKVCIKL